MYCIKCGKTLNEADKYCVVCGTPVGGIKDEAAHKSGAAPAVKSGWNRNLSWKFLIPAGFIILFVFDGGVVSILGTILIIFGAIDLFRSKK